MFYSKMIFSAVILMTLGCEFRNAPERVNKTPSKIDTPKINNIVVYGNKRFDTTGFLANCEKLKNGSSVGALQGTNHSHHSTGYLCFMECYDCKESYEIILSLEGGVEKRKTMGYDKIGKNFDSGCNNKFRDFESFAFVLPMRDPENQKDIHAMNIDFPVTVKVYERVDLDNWKFIKKVRVKSFEVFSNLQFKTIYRLK